VLLWQEGFYEETVFVNSDRELASPMFPELELNVEQVLAAGNLDRSLAFS
jgi:hypothetical protein